MRRAPVRTRPKWTTRPGGPGEMRFDGTNDSVALPPASGAPLADARSVHAVLDMDLLAERLARVRRVLDLSQTALAHKAGVNLSNLNELEQGHKPGVRADTIVALALALGVSTDYLLGLSDDPTPHA